MRLLTRLGLQRPAAPRCAVHGRFDIAGVTVINPTRGRREGQTIAIADGAAAAHAKEFLELGIDPDQVVQVVRVLAEGLSHAAQVMRVIRSTVRMPRGSAPAPGRS